MASTALETKGMCIILQGTSHYLPVLQHVKDDSF